MKIYLRKLTHSFEFLLEQETDKKIKLRMVKVFFHLLKA